jgi:hypothetical protein
VNILQKLTPYAGVVLYLLSPACAQAQELRTLIVKMWPKFMEYMEITIQNKSQPVVGVLHPND